MRKALRSAAAISAVAAGLGAAGIGVVAATAGAAASPQAALSTTPTWTAQVTDGGLHGGVPIKWSSPNVATLAGGKAVVVGDAAGKVYAYTLATGSTVAGFPYAAPAAVTSTASVAPGPGTGRDTLLVGVGNVANGCAGGYQWIRPTGNDTFLRATNPATDPSCGGANGVEASMAVGTLQGVTATVAGSMGENEWAFNAANSAALGGFPWFQGDTDLSTPAIADVEGTGANQIVEGGASTAGLAYTRNYGNGGHILVLSGNGNAGQPQPNDGLVCEYTTNQEVTSSPAVGKFLGGTAVGIVAGTGSYYAGASQTNQLIALNSGCGVAWTDTLAGTTKASPALADVMGNGKLQVVTYTQTGTVYALTGANGAAIWSKKLPRATVGMGSPVTVDLGGGYEDVLVASNNGLFVLTGKTGATLQAPLENTVSFQNSPLVTQDPTGAIGITAAGAGPTASYVFHWTLSGTNGSVVNEAGAWPGFHHDPQLTGDAGTPPPTVEVPCTAPATGHPTGYYESAADGGIFDFGGNLPFCGSTGSLRLNKPVVGIAATPNGGGYWEVASDGGLFAFGNAQFYGSMGGKPLNQPIVGMAPTPTGGGYWEVASDGGIFAFGNAQFYGSMGGRALNAPIVGIAANPNGKGYWEVAADGGIFAFGTAPFYGSMGGKPLNKPIVGISANPNGNGYWEVASDGGIFAFGTAPFYGSMGGKPLNQPIVGIAANRNGNGYWEVASDGGIFAFGTAPFYGSMGGKPLNKPIVGISGF